jgi:putative nucleotidyltransferase with HDIG domain
MDLRTVVVDDEQLARDELGYLLGQVGGVEVIGQAGNGVEALATIDRLQPDVVFLDVQMPGLTGFEVARRMLDSGPSSQIIFVTAYDQHALRAFQVKALDYLLKPFDRIRLLEALSLARDWHAAAAGADELHEALQDRLRTRRAVLAAALAEAQTTHSAALDGLITMLQFHERDGRGHSRRVARLTLALADELGVGDDASLLQLEHGALLHDIGKLDVPASILTKPAPLDDQEWGVMKRHPQVGYDLLRKLPRFAGAARLVLAHHEAYDGSGYPNGLQGDKIPIGARILAIADSYDSMTHPHTQRPPMPPAMALSEIERCSGTQFDPVVASALGEVFADVAQEQVTH